MPTSNNVVLGQPHRSSVDAAIAVRLKRIGVVLQWRPSAVASSTAIVLVVLGFVVSGVVGASAAMCGSVVVAVVIDQVGLRRERAAADVLLPEIALRLSRSLRSGQTVDVALLDLTSDLSGEHPAIRTLLAQTNSGRPLGEAIAGWVASATSQAEHLLAVALHVGLRLGGEVASSLDIVGDGIRDDLELDARRRVLLTQTRLSAMVLVALPIVFAAVASAAKGGSIYQGLVGAGLLAAGLSLDLLGVAWMHRLMRGLS